LAADRNAADIVDGHGSEADLVDSIVHRRFPRWIIAPRSGTFFGLAF
jgi:hypothetical protein